MLFVVDYDTRSNNPVTLRYYVAVQTAQWQTSVRYPALSPQSPPRVTCRANTRGWGATFLRSHTNEHDSLTRIPLMCTTAIWKIICHAGGDGGARGRGLGGGWRAHPSRERAGRSFRLHTPSVFSPYTPHDVQGWIENMFKRACCSRVDEIILGLLYSGYLESQFRTVIVEMLDTFLALVYSLLWKIKCVLFFIMSILLKLTDKIK